MSRAALGATITQLQRAVQARIANEQAFKVRVYNELNASLARLRHCAVVAAAAPPGPAAAAALVDLNREIGLLQTEVGNLQNNLLDENDVDDVMNTVRREGPNIRFDTAANMQRFTRAPPPYVYPGPGRRARPLVAPPAPASGLLGSLGLGGLGGLGGVFGSSSASGSGSASGAVGSAGADGADGADGAGRRRVGAIGSADEVDLGEDGYPIGSGLPVDFNPGPGTDPFPPPPAYPGPAYNGPGPWGPAGPAGPAGPRGPGGPGGDDRPRSGGWTPKRKTPKRKPKKKSVRR
jgi:hypothetical protein